MLETTVRYVEEADRIYLPVTTLPPISPALPPALHKFFTLPHTSIHPSPTLCITMAGIHGMLLQRFLILNRTSPIHPSTPCASQWRVPRGWSPAAPEAGRGSGAARPSRAEDGGLPETCFPHQDQHHHHPCHRRCCCLWIRQPPLRPLQHQHPTSAGCWPRRTQKRLKQLHRLQSVLLLLLPMAAATC